MLAYYLIERRKMKNLSGFLGFVGLIAMTVMLLGQTPSLEVLTDRGADNRRRIEVLETSSSQIDRRLIRIETELEQSRKQSESNGQLLTGLIVGVGVILFERAMVFLSYIRSKV